jgi:hypothetical protein
MKINKEYFFIFTGEFSKSSDLEEILIELRAAIKSVTWPNEDFFILNPTRRGNGVVPIKSNFIKTLLSFGWKTENRMSFAVGINPGPVDVIKDTKFGKFVVEWETGNISSSHRALNKIAVGIIQDAIIGGILILPTKELAHYLTDRIGNYEEIAPYFSLYENVFVDSGFMGVISVDFDDISLDSPLIPKGKDGNAKKSLL